MSRDVRKPVFGVSNQVRHKPACAPIEDGLMKLEILDLGRRGTLLYYPCSENKGADQLSSYCKADLRLCFRMGNNPVFSQCGSNGLKTKCLFVCLFELMLNIPVNCYGHVSRCLKKKQTYTSCASL